MKDYISERKWLQIQCGDQVGGHEKGIAQSGVIDSHCGRLENLLLGARAGC